MSGKTVPFKMAGKRRTEDDAATDVFVETGEKPSEPMQRVSVDVPVSLHRRIKSQCALRGTKMADEIRVLLETHFPES